MDTTASPNTRMVGFRKSFTPSVEYDVIDKSSDRLKANFRKLG